MLGSYDLRLAGRPASVNLNVNNLFNEEYLRNYGEANNFTRLDASYGQFRQVKLSLNVGF